jgi:hypothetical protein
METAPKNKSRNRQNRQYDKQYPHIPSERPAAQPRAAIRAEGKIGFDRYMAFFTVHRGRRR